VAAVLANPVQGHNHRKFTGSGKGAIIGHFLAVVLVGPVRARSHLQFPGSAFSKPNAGTQLSAILWQWFW